MIFAEHDWPWEVFPKQLPFVSFQITVLLRCSAPALLALQDRTCRRISRFATAVLCVPLVRSFRRIT